MKAVIMAGGRGTRLSPLTRRIPKPMVPLLDRPVMEYMVDLLHRSGIREVGVTLGHLPDAIRMYFGDGSRFLVRMTYAIEKNALGTAGGVKNLQDFLNEPFVVVSGDGVTDFDLREAMKVHKDNGALVTIVLTQVENPSGFGIVETSDSGWVTKFIEKPANWDPNLIYYANTGIYIMEPEVFSLSHQIAHMTLVMNCFPNFCNLECLSMGITHLDIGQTSGHFNNTIKPN